MGNEEVKKVQLVKTSKDILNLLKHNDSVSGSGQGNVTAGNAIQQILFGFWEMVLGHSLFGIQDSFFQAGGDSLKAIQLLSRISSHFSIRFSLNDLFLHPAIEQFALLIPGKENDRRPFPSLVKKTERPSFIPLSFNQERLWFIHKLEGSLSYHVPVVFRLKGALNREALVYAFRQIIERHEILRTLILEEQGQGYQVVQNGEQWRLSYTTGHAFKQDQPALQQYIQQLISKPFDLATDYMLRAELILLDEQEHVLVVTLHHIAADGWSGSLLVKEFVRVYNKYETGSYTRLEPLALQYADFAMWQRQLLRSVNWQVQLTYWKEKLSGVAPLQLPADYPRPAVQQFNGAFQEFTINKELAVRLHGLNQQYDVTLFMTLLACWKMLLFRYSEQQDICVGTAVAGRSEAKLEELIGFFANTVALRTRVEGDMSFIELLNRVKSVTLEALENQELPFEKVVEAVSRERDLGRNPVFQVLFVLQNTPKRQVVNLGDAVLSEEPFGYNRIKFELEISLHETPYGIHGLIGYCTDLYQEQTVCRMANHYKRLLEAVVSSPASAISLLPMLGNGEINQLLVDFNETHFPYPGGQTIISLLEQQVEKTPDARALIFDEETLTYRELNELANQLSHYLYAHGVGAETRIAICIERGLYMVVAMLGVLKTGAAYVPVDPEYPVERISFMLEDTAAVIMLTSKKAESRLPPQAGLQTVYMDLDWPAISRQPRYNESRTITSGQLAYIIYTSGSTGKPKGVMIRHGNVYSFISWCRHEFAASPFDTVYAGTSVCFDLSIFEIFYPLSIGKQVRIIQNWLYSATCLPFDSHVLINSVPSVIQSLITAGTDLTGVSVINMAGEPIPLHVQQSLDTGRIEVRNLYGPSEGTTYNTVARVSSHFPVTIGKPIHNTCIRILSSELQLVPVGVFGEICVGGAGVAEGYLNLEALTAEKFITDPFAAGTQVKMYRTGDRGRWLADGNIEYAGRMDEQVKINGYRIEPGEIEIVLLQSQLFVQAVVLMNQDNQGSKRLVAYVIPKGVFDQETVLSYLRNKLPDYMIPVFWIELEKLPLTPNGKVDKKALPQPDVKNLFSDQFAAPRNKPEAILAGIWKELLGVSQVDIHDNFFELGGDSIMILQVVSCARKAGYTLHPKDLFIYQTVEKLAGFLNRTQKDVPEGEQGVLSGTAGLLPIQQAFLERNQENIANFNQSLLLGIRKNITGSWLQEAFDQLVLQHDALGFEYKKQKSWNQLYGRRKPILILEDFRAALPDQVHEMVQVCAARHQQLLDIVQEGPVKVVWMQTPDAETNNRLLIIIHHLVIDGVSWRILLEDLERLLDAINSGRPYHFDQKTSSYRQWYHALEKHGGSSVLLSQKEYWQQPFSEWKSLPVDKVFEGAVTAKNMSRFTIRLDAEQTRGLLYAVPSVYHTEVTDLLLGALVKSMCAWMGKQKLVVWMEGHGREDLFDRLDLSRSVGWFTSIYPVLLEAETAAGDGGLIKSVKEQLRKVPGNGLGYGILNYMQNENPLPEIFYGDVLFNYLGQLDKLFSKNSWLTADANSFQSTLDNEFTVREKLQINCYVAGGEMIMNWSFSSLHYHAQTMHQLGAAYLSCLKQLTDHCLQQSGDKNRYTPSDFGLGAEIGYKELDRFLDECVYGKKRREQIDFMTRLSGLQLGMLFHGIYDLSSGTYINQMSADISGADTALIQQSWQQLIKHHNVLRSAFYYQAFSIPVQCVYKEASLGVEIQDYREIEDRLQPDAVEAVEEAERAKGFDLASAPLMRIVLCQLGSDKWKMILTYHHILFDGWSLMILLEEFLRTYEGLLKETPPSGTEHDHYEDYIRYLELRNKTVEEEYWRLYLQGLKSGTLLPFITNTAGRTKGAGKYRTATLQYDHSQTKSIQQFAKSHQITVSTFMQGIWALLLHHYTGHAKVVYGVTVSGRPDDLAGVEKRVGMYINTLPLCVDLDDDQTMVNWLRSLQHDQVASRQYQFAHLSDIQRWSGISGDLFDSVLVFENYPVNEYLNSQGPILCIENVRVHEQTNYPLTITIRSTGLIQIDFSYNSNLLTEWYACQIKDHFNHVIGQVLANPGAKLPEVRLLSDSWKQKLLAWSKGCERKVPADKTVVDLFEEQAHKTPGATALVFEEEQLTFCQLAASSSQLAHYLLSQGLPQQSLVAIALERSVSMVVAILGVLKAGAAYVPLDPAYPPERINFILRDTAACMVIGSRSSPIVIPDGENYKIVLLDADQLLIRRENTRLPNTRPASHHLAYVMYTSGTTARPKGVMVEHASLLNYLLNSKTRYITGLENTAGSFVHLSPAFDASLTALFMPLLAGKTVVIAGTAHVNLFEDPNLMKWAPYEFIKVTPAHLALLEHTVQPSQRNWITPRLVIGGEALHYSHLHLFIHNGLDVEVINEYGPTEATVGCSVYTFHTASALATGNVTIGNPIDNLQLYIVDKKNEPVPAGVSGELCIGGAGLARGYVNQPELTTEKFVPDPFSPVPARMYKTGDVCRWLPNGHIEYLRRADDQVKVRGYRIEPAEIESVLQESGLVSHNVVLLGNNENGMKRLICYYVPLADADKQIIEDYLLTRLPEYMVPASWVRMDKMPLTTQGKVDKSSLLSVKAAPVESPLYTAPHTKLEKQLVRAWQQLLAIEKVSIHDNFFELGGDSILSIQLVGRLHRQGCELQPKDVFVYQTIASLAAAVTARSGLQSVAEQGILTGSCGLLPIQQWYLQQHDNNSPFNQSVLLQIDKTVTSGTIRQAMLHLSLHHDALRFRYREEAAHWQQQYGSVPPAVQTENLQDVTGSALRAHIEYLASNYHRQLNIEEGHLLQAVLIETPVVESHNRLLLIVHHLAVDGVSWRILLEDLASLLQALMQGIPAGLGLKRSSYRQWFHALEQYGQSSGLHKQLGYWSRTRYNQVPLRTDKDHAGRVEAERAYFQTRLDLRQTSLLFQQAPRAYHTQSDDLLICALVVTLCRWNYSTRILIALEGHGRQAIPSNVDTTRTVGWFTSLYPVLLEAEEYDLPEKLIKTIKEQLRQIPDQGLGYGVLKYINREASLQGDEPWEVVFNYLGQLDTLLPPSSWLQGNVESAGAEVSLQRRVTEKLAVNCWVQSGQLVINWMYSTRHFDASTAEHLSRTYIAELQSLTNHCLKLLADGLPVHTPSDYGLGLQVHYEELDTFLEQLCHGRKRKEQIETLYQLSGLQQGMFFHSQYKLGSYHEQLSCGLVGLNLPHLKESWKQVMNNHNILRSAFYHDVFSTAVQVVYRQVTLPVSIIDCRAMSQDEQTAAVKTFEEADRNKSFDFTEAPLMRLTMMHLDKERYHMIWSFHHILMDGWSLQVVIEELLNTYEKLLAGHTAPERNPSTDDYGDYIRYLQAVDQPAAESYWRNYLLQVEQGTFLPFIDPTIKRNEGGNDYSSFCWNPGAERQQALRSYAQRHRLTVNTVMQGIWALLLHRYTGNNDIVYGIVVSVRPAVLEKNEKRVGLYINTLPLRSKLQENQGVTAWLQSLQNEQLESLQHSSASLQEIQGWVQASQGELFDSLLVFENYPLSDQIGSGSRLLKMEDVRLVEHTNYALTIVVKDTAEMSVEFSYNQALLEEVYIKQISEHFEQVLQEFLQKEHAAIEEIEWISETEKHRLLKEFNSSDEKIRTGTTVISLFEQQVAKTPQALAVVYEERELTYRELDEWANQLAAYLRSKGVQEETVVPLCTERSVEMMVAILGIMKAGGAYLPVDPNSPVERIRFILEDCWAGLMLSTKQFQPAHLQNETTKIEVIDLKQLLASINRQPPQPLSQISLSDRLAYVIYTSGSSGTPKGVMIGHSSLLNYILDAQTRYGSDYQGNAGSFIHLPFTFDASLTGIFVPLVSGKFVVIGSKHGAEVFDDPQLQKWAPYDFIKITPAHLKLLEPMAGKGTRNFPANKLVIGGEPLHWHQFDYLANSGMDVEIINEYGPTEATVGCSTYAIHLLRYPEHKQKVPVGKPMSGVQLYVLDQRQRLMPIGTYGEICIGGAGLARGYINSPGLTSRKFISHPFSSSGSRLYRTGDIGRWLPDGNIEYQGRLDEQVKIRGYRIELGEVERVLQQSSQVNKAAVLTKVNQTGEQELVAYIVPSAGYQKKSLIHYLKQRLPEYMMPAAWVILQELPLTPNGKINKKMLPEADPAERATSQFVAPRNELETKIAAVWKEVLSLERIGVHDNFFELGGHSILVMRMISSIRRKLDAELSVRTFFELKTLEELASYIRVNQSNNRPMHDEAYETVNL